MARFNLVCHGMMLFHEVDNNTVDIYLPQIDGHLRAISTARQPVKSDLEPLVENRRYTLEGITAQTGALTRLFSARDYLSLRKDQVQFNAAAAEAVSVVVRVPMPSRIRLYRASEPEANPLAEIDAQVLSRICHDIPLLYHDVVVFSYLNHQIGDLVALNPQPADTSAAGFSSRDKTVTWSLLSTEPGPAIAAHPTVLDSFIRFDGQTLKLHLSDIGLKEGRLHTQIGISPDHMATPHELPDQGASLDLTCSDKGCSGVVIGN